MHEYIYVSLLIRKANNKSRINRGIDKEYEWKRKILEELWLKILSSIGKSNDNTKSATAVTSANDQNNGYKRSLLTSQVFDNKYKHSTKRYKLVSRNSNVIDLSVVHHSITATKSYTSKKLHGNERSNQSQSRYQKIFKVKERYSQNNVSWND